MDRYLIFFIGFVIFTLIYLLSSLSERETSRKTSLSDKELLKRENDTFMNNIFSSLGESLHRTFSNIKGSVKSKIIINESNLEIHVSRSLIKKKASMKIEVFFTNNFLKNIDLTRESYQMISKKFFGSPSIKTDDDEFDKRFFLQSQNKEGYIVFTEKVRKAWIFLDNALMNVETFKLEKKKLIITLPLKTIHSGLLPDIFYCLKTAVILLEANNSIEAIFKNTIIEENDPHIIRKVCAIPGLTGTADKYFKDEIIGFLKKRHVDIQIAAASSLYHFKPSYFLLLVRSKKLNLEFLYDFIASNVVEDVTLLYEVFQHYDTIDIQRAVIKNLIRINDLYSEDFLLHHYTQANMELKKVILIFFKECGTLDTITKMHELLDVSKDSEKSMILNVEKKIRSRFDKGGWVTITERNDKEGNISISESDGSISLKD